ncbi:uncharacterized protein LOC121804027 [Salvia splendens]|uniref:uncharacterized protein LOC121804027 n=1 Tax=Salvia splendens TaxID=180675 RepID=UPI001C26F87B|nr:uncharacterized protein LOC121804027 [Salvia splendens]
MQNFNGEELLLLPNAVAVLIQIWSQFSRWFPEAPEFGRRDCSLEERLRWWQRHLKCRNKRHICILIPCLIFWYIWTERNGCVHCENVFKTENVCKRIVLHLRNLVLAGQIGPDHWQGCVPRVDFMTAKPRECRTKRVEKVQWRPPDFSWLKLNTDGAYEGASGKAGAGGIIRNHLGDIVEGFYTPLTAASGFEAELKALLERIVIAKAHSCNLWLETDAERLFSILEKNHLWPAEMRHNMARIYMELRDIQWKVTCIRREGNKVADLMASLGKESQSLTRLGAD